MEGWLQFDHIKRKHANSAAKPQDDNDSDYEIVNEDIQKFAPTVQMRARSRSIATKVLLDDFDKLQLEADSQPEYTGAKYVAPMLQHIYYIVNIVNMTVDQAIRYLLLVCGPGRQNLKASPWSI